MEINYESKIKDLEGIINGLFDNIAGLQKENLRLKTELEEGNK